MNSCRKVGDCENWWDKCRVTLTGVEGERDGAVKVLQGVLRGLGYV